ncbi:MAG: AAA family ATPase [Pirellulales bacterium]
MKIGLTLGKFAPLHRGHQLVIETALAEMDHVIVMIYDVPDVTPVPLPVRAAWIRKLYPQVTVVEAWDGPLEVSHDPRITALHDEYICRRMSGRGVTHFYSSEFYGEHVSLALGAIDRRVDENRTQVPISATAVRERPHANRSYLDPVVLRDLSTHIVFLGAPCTGKTTIAQFAAAAFHTTWVPEFGREYWEQHQVDRRLTLEQLVEIGTIHRRREDESITVSSDILFVDTNALTTRMFSLYYHEQCHPELERMADECRSRYDITFVCDTDIPYDDTWDRSGQVFREVFQRRIIADLKTRKVPFAMLRGSIEQRLQQVQESLRAFRKYT